MWRVVRVQGGGVGEDGPAGVGEKCVTGWTEVEGHGDLVWMPRFGEDGSVGWDLKVLEEMTDEVEAVDPVDAAPGHVPIQSL